MTQTILFPVAWKEAARKLLHEAVEDFLSESGDVMDQNRQGWLALKVFFDGLPRDWKIEQELGRPRK